MVEERRAMVSRNTENLIYHGYLNVEIRNGKAMFPPDFITWQTYRPVNFRIPCNQCQEIALLNEFNSKLEAKLEICFFENALYIDPSTHDTDKLLGSLAIYWSPLWQSGFNYENVSSTGRVKLNDVTIEVHQINED